MNKSDMTVLDKLFSEFIRRRAMARVGGCEKCGTRKRSWKELQCSHFYGRTKKSVRWDEDNAAGICGGCHLFLGNNPLDHTRWFEAQLGQRAALLLEARASTPQKTDAAALKIYLKAKLREVVDAE